MAGGFAIVRTVSCTATFGGSRDRPASPRAKLGFNELRLVCRRHGFLPFDWDDLCPAQSHFLIDEGQAAPGWRDAHETTRLHHAPRQRGCGLAAGGAGAAERAGAACRGAVNAARLAFGLTKTETNGRWFEPAERTSHRGTMVQRPKNGLLASIPASEWIEVQSLCEPVKLPLGRVLYEPRGSFDYVYFPETAIISNVAPLKTGKTAETSITGREGLVNVGAIMGDDQSMHRAVVHVSGDGTRISFREFQELQARLPVFRRKLNAYSRAFLAQVMQSVACNASHTLRPALRSMAVEVSRPCRR